MRSVDISWLKMASVIAVAGSLVACGGSSKNNENEQTTGWVAGVFQNEDNFKDLCQNPRSGTDPFNNNRPYPDTQGTTLDENNWLRSWSNNTYLWYDEITDRNPANYSDPLDYFDLLKTNATTPSGNPKDKFHFTADTQAYNESSIAGVSAGYGSQWAIISATPPRKIVVAFTEANSPAADNNLFRGAEILEIDGVDVVNDNTQAGVDVLNAGLFPSDVNESHTFRVRDLNSSTEREFTLTSEEITSDPVLLTSTIDTPTGKVGYIVFNDHNVVAEESLFDAFTLLSNEGVNDLVLDLRYNGGGYGVIAAQVGYMAAGAANTENKTFYIPTFNDKHPDVDPVNNRAITPVPFVDTGVGLSLTEGQALPSLNLNRVYVLTTGSTCSASEAIINGLLGADIEVIQIGETTCGKPVGFYPTDNCGTTYFTVQIKLANEKGFGDYNDGFSPVNTMGTVGEVVNGCSVADDFDHVLGDTSEALLAAALQYRVDGSCPTPSAKTQLHFKTKDGLSIFDSQQFQMHDAIKNNLNLSFDSKAIKQ